jgi:hypothetical protein
MTNLKAFLSVAVTTILLSACSSTKEDTAPTSGFLSDYSQLAEVKTTDESITKRWNNNDVSMSSYDNIIFKPVEYFPSLPKSERISPAVAQQVKTEMNSHLKASLEKSYNLVDTAGKGTAEMQVAITGLTIDESKLSAYQYIPVAFLITAATGKLNDMSVKIQIEMKLIDSTTGKLLMAVTKVDAGEALDNKDTQLDYDMHLKPLLEKWFASFDATIAQSKS